MSNTPKVSRFVWGTLWFDSIRMLHLNLIRRESRLTNRLPAWQIDNRRNDLCQHFQPTLHSPPEVKIHEITIHEPSSFLKRGHKLQSIHTIRVDSIELTQIDNIFNPPSVQIDYIKSHANRQTGKLFVSIRWNRVHESISGLSNHKYQRRINSSWVYWTTITYLMRATQ